jgi:lysophospholipase L1-like esterase
MSARIRTTAKIIGILATIVLSLVCAVGGYLWFQARKMPAGAPEYVAMGSSFAAGPGIASRTSDSPSFCAQSDHNYAHQLAQAKHYSLIDMSCGGATSEHILRGGQIFQGAQVRAVTEVSRLATITIGGNDISYLGNLIALGCGPQTSWLLRLFGACHAASDSSVDAGFQRLSRNLRAIGAEIHRRSASARIIVINYPVILPPQGTCSRLGLSAAAADKMRTIASRLDETTREAAQAIHAELLDAAALSVGHDACSAQPWVTGANPGGLSAPLHPNLAGMTAIAQALDVMISNGPLTAKK